MTDPRLIIFDCDGVLIDSEVISARQLIAELKGYGVEMDMAFVSRHFLGRSYPVVLKEVRERWGVQLPDRFEADYRARLLAALAALAGWLASLARWPLPWTLGPLVLTAAMTRSVIVSRMGQPEMVRNTPTVTVPPEISTPLSMPISVIG